MPGMLRRAGLVFGIGVCLVWITTLAGAGPDKDGLYEIEGANIVAHIKFLADDKNKGRAAGSPGCFAGGDYIAARLKQLTPPIRVFVWLFALISSILVVLSVPPSTALALTGAVAALSFPQMSTVLTR